MMTIVAVAVVVLIPWAAILALALTADRVGRRREERRLRQIAVTDAIHREVGPVVAPVVEKRAWGPWRLLIAVPFDRPVLVSAVLGAAQRALAELRLQPVEIVLVPRAR